MKLFFIQQKLITLQLGLLERKILDDLKYQIRVKQYYYRDSPRTQAFHYTHLSSFFDVVQFSYCIVYFCLIIDYNLLFVYSPNIKDKSL